MSGWKHYLAIAGISLGMIVLAQNGVFSFLPGMPAKSP